MESWGDACKTRLKRVQTKQNPCFRCMFFAHTRENANIYYALLEILELNNIYKMKIALFGHKIQNDKRSIPAVFSGAFTLTSIEVHCHHPGIPWVPEAFHARFPVSVNSPLVSSAFGRRRVGLWPTKLLVEREKKPLVPRVHQVCIKAKLQQEKRNN